MNMKNRFRLVIFSMVALLVSIAIVVTFGIRHTNVHIRESTSMDDLIVDLYELRILNKEFLDTPSARIEQQWRTVYSQIKTSVGAEKLTDKWNSWLGYRMNRETGCNYQETYITDQIAKNLLNQNNLQNI